MTDNNIRYTYEPMGPHPGILQSIKLKNNSNYRRDNMEFSDYKKEALKDKNVKKT